MIKSLCFISRKTHHAWQSDGSWCPSHSGKTYQSGNPSFALEKEKKSLIVIKKCSLSSLLQHLQKLSLFFKKFTIHHLCSIDSLLPLLCFPFLPNLYVVVLFKLIHDSETIIQTHVDHKNHIQEDRVAPVTPLVTLLHTSCFPYFPRASYFAERAADA